MPKLIPFLNASACMSKNRRFQLAVITWSKTLPENLDKLSEEEIIDKVVIPLIQFSGWAEWERDTVTDMAIKKGLITEGEIWEHEKDSSELPESSK